MIRKFDDDPCHAVLNALARHNPYMSALLHELENLSFRTLPAVEQERYDGWVLRWAPGGSRRAKSVNPVEPSSLPIEEKVEYCRAWFARRGSTCRFRLTPLADESLRPALAAAGYQAHSPTDVMLSDIGEHTMPLHGEVSSHVEVSRLPSHGWLELVTGMSPTSTAATRLADQLTSGDGTHNFATYVERGDTAAAGVGIDLDRFTTIYNMMTAPQWRRRGYGRAILETLLARGSSSGSTHAVLQVTRDNHAAIGLYRSVGFETVYSYEYFEPLRAG